MRNPLEVIFSFPRFYLTLYLFGREFTLDVGYFETAEQEDWEFGPELVLLGKLTGKGGPSGKGGFVSYWSRATIRMFTGALGMSVGVVKYK